MSPRAGLGLARFVAITALALAVSGCGGGSTSTPVAAPPAPPPTAPPYDASLPPGRAVLALVPSAAATLRLTNWAEIRTQVCLPESTSLSSDADRSRFWRLTPHHAPLLTHSLLLVVDRRLRSAYGFGADDVAWEARWTGGGVGGWALAFRPGLDMATVARAVRAGIGPLRGATVQPSDHLVVSAPVVGAAWANDIGWEAVSGGIAEATYLGRGCAKPAAESLEPLGQISVSFGDHVVTARLGHERMDLFERMRLDRPNQAFTALYRNAVGDPSSGRIGWIVPHPDRAARLAVRNRWPFAGCGQQRS